MLQSKFGKDCPSSSREAYVDAIRTLQNDGHKPIAIVHQSDSGDFKMYNIANQYSENSHYFDKHKS